MSIHQRLSLFIAKLNVAASAALRPGRLEAAPPINDALFDRIVSVHDGVARARIEGELRMQHSFYHKEDGKTVEATVLGSSILSRLRERSAPFCS